MMILKVLNRSHTDAGRGRVQGQATAEYLLLLLAIVVLSTLLTPFFKHVRTALKQHYETAAKRILAK